MTDISQPSPTIESSIAEASDRFHPFLVKELRRSLKARGFLIGLAAFLVGMSVVTQIMIGEANTSGRVDNDIWGWVIFIQSVYFLFFIPFFGAQKEDVNGDDSMMDLLRMTTMTPLSIVVGRWLTLVFFIVVYGIIMVPFYFLRYLLGGYNVAEGLGVLGVTLLGSLLISAWGTASIYMMNKRLRTLANGVFLFIAWVVVVAILEKYFTGHRGSGLNGMIWLFAGSIVFLAIGVLLSLGANGLAAPAQRRMRGVRGFYTILCILGVCASVISKDQIVIEVTAMAVVFGLVLTCLEPPILPTERIFAGAQSARKLNIFQKFLDYPGIGFGFWPWLLGAVGFACVVLWMDVPKVSLSAVYFMTSAFCLIAWGYFVSRVLRKRMNHSTACVVGLLIIVLLNLAILLLGFAGENLGLNFLDSLGAWLPLVIIFEMGNAPTDVSPWAIYFSTSITLIVFSLMALKERRSLAQEEANLHTA